MEIIKRKDLPPELAPVYFDFHWSQKKLWALDLPASVMNVSKFIWLLDYPVWASNPPRKIFDLKPGEVLCNLDNFPKHKIKILNSNCDFPIHVMFWHEKWLILDGVHRLLKKIINNDTEILVKIVPLFSIYNIQPDRNSPDGFLKYEITNQLTQI